MSDKPIISKMRNIEDGTFGYYFWCPGCNEAHRVQTGNGKGPRWQFNNDMQKPTFTPSIKVTRPKVCCHSFITDGQIKFLDDCTHKLNGRTVDLPELPDWLQ